MLYEHEIPGIKYLLSIGYETKDIYITNGSPDIITKNDNQYWEIKFVRSGRLYFTANQLHMDGETNILVFDDNNSGPIDIVKFVDILSGRHYRYSFGKDKNKYIKDKNKYIKDKNKYIKDKNKYIKDKNKYIKDVNNILNREYKFTVRPTIISSVIENNIDRTDPDEMVEKVLKYILSLSV